MPRLSLWDSGKKSFDYRYIDKAISESFGIGGTCIFAHLYIGPYQQAYPMTNSDGSTVPAYHPENPLPQPIDGNVTSIQDVLFLENRDRRYSNIVYELRGWYAVGELDYDLRQFGMFLQTDTLFIEFHLNDMTAILGRRLMPGDVLEIPHRRDETSVNLEAPMVNKFYVIEDAVRASTGYSVTWWPHIWRTKLSPMTGSQEFQDILDQQATNPLGLDQGRLGDLMSTIAIELGINEAVVEQAKTHVGGRYFETQQYWMVIPEILYSNPWVFAGDGIPPNGAVPLGAGRRFPEAPQQGDYYLRTDYKPATLFMYDANAWRFQEQDIRQQDWTAAHNLLRSFINETGTSVFEDHTTSPTRINLSQAVKPRADF